MWCDGHSVYLFLLRCHSPEKVREEYLLCSLRMLLTKCWWARNRDWVFYSLNLCVVRLEDSVYYVLLFMTLTKAMVIQKKNIYQFFGVFHLHVVGLEREGVFYHVVRRGWTIVLGIKCIFNWNCYLLKAAYAVILPKLMAKSGVSFKFVLLIRVNNNCSSVVLPSKALLLCTQ